MAAKLVYASMVAAASAHSLYVRDTDVKVNRDSYGAPAPASYGAPAPSYSAPASSYNAPSSSYSSGGSSYSAPETGYTSPSGYGEETGGLDLTAIIIPLLALLGLSLLFPTFVSVTARRKRDVDEIGEGSGPMGRVLDRVNDIYFSMIESEECMERIACEVGGIAKDFGLNSSPVTKMIDPLVTKKYKTYYKQFASGRNCQKIKCGSFSL
ncbi:uncharacterized protein [Lepeophtheirus salmonis]|uniref:Uncharacterized protein n=1 Tax=Lepeophtheirus salmonis TaxID=72036 RepID=A0A0K2TW61_LEPSM